MYSVQGRWWINGVALKCHTQNIVSITPSTLYNSGDLLQNQWLLLIRLLPLEKR